MAIQSYPTSRDGSVDLAVAVVDTPPVQRIPLRVAGRLDPLMVATFAIAVSAAGAARPSFWYDEAATVSAATRSLPDLFRLLGKVDAVHGLYYLLMEAWFAVFPATEFWSRAPSALAVGIAAAGVVVLARQFTGRATAICAGVAFAILPRTTWAGMEARSYGFQVLLAVWLTVLFVVAVRNHRQRTWLQYGGVLVVAAVLNMYLVLLVVVYGVFLRMLSRSRSTALWWAAATAGALLAVTPLILLSLSQIAQISWVLPLRARTWDDVFVDQYFDDSIPFAVAAGVVIAVALVLQSRPGTRWDEPTRRLVLMCAVWMVLPTAVLLVVTAFGKHMYTARYLYFTTPAMAILLGICVVTIARGPWRSAAVFVLLALAALPNYLQVQRASYGKEGMDYSQVADLIGATARPGDCLLLDNTVRWLTLPIRALTAARPAAYEKLVDPGRGEPRNPGGELWDAPRLVFDVADKVNDCRVLWTVSRRDRALAGHDVGSNLKPGTVFGRAPAYQVPKSLGFRIVERWQFNFAQVTRSENIAPHYFRPKYSS
jgi:mannosyltransferase